MPAFTTPSETKIIQSPILSCNSDSRIVFPSTCRSSKGTGTDFRCRKRIASGVSNSTTRARPSRKNCPIANVLYASFRTSHTGNVLPNVSTTSLSGSSFSIRCITIRVVRIDRILALTPLPNPSARASVT